jgi:hypothetical protein
MSSMYILIQLDKIYCLCYSHICTAEDHIYDMLPSSGTNTPTKDWTPSNFHLPESSRLHIHISEIVHYRRCLQDIRRQQEEGG